MFLADHTRHREVRLGDRSSPDPSCNGVTESWIRSRVPGGSSSINGIVLARGAAQGFDRWSALCRVHRGPPGACWQFAAVSRPSDRPSDVRGKSEPLHVRTVRHPHDTTNAFIGAAGQVGLLVNDDYNAGLLKKCSLRAVVTEVWRSWCLSQSIQINSYSGWLTSILRELNMHPIWHPGVLGGVSRCI